jgi:hypothetical protein
MVRESGGTNQANFLTRPKRKDDPAFEIPRLVRPFLGQGRSEFQYGGDPGGVVVGAGMNGVLFTFVLHGAARFAMAKIDQHVLGRRRR